MKITIDTQHDTHKEIQRVISLLQHLTDNQGHSEVIENSTEVNSPFENMFAAKPQEVHMEQEEQQPSFESSQAEPVETPQLDDQPQGVFNLFQENPPQPKHEEELDEKEAAPPIITYL